VPGEAEQVLAEQIAAIEDAPFDELVERFTELSRAWLRRRRRSRESKMDEVTEVRGPSGTLYDVETWGALDSADDLHVFVTVFGTDPEHGWMEPSADTIVSRISRSATG
jgi:hypothetical protein